MDVKLTDAGMELIRASDAFRELDPQVCADLETHLYHAFPAGEAISEREAQSRISACLDGPLEQTGPIREVILGAIRTF